jgi:hypothetical protein
MLHDSVDQRAVELPCAFPAGMPFLYYSYSHYVPIKPSVPLMERHDGGAAARESFASGSRE